MPRVSPDRSHVFSRAIGRDLPVAVRAEGAHIWDSDGRRYLDAAGGAVVVGIGHGDAEVAGVIAEQAGRIAYAHGTMFTSEPLEAYADELGELLPMEGARLYPVAGGSEAVETAFKIARAYHLARGEGSRHKIVSRWQSYHGNTRGALDASGRPALHRPYQPWLGLAVHVSPANEYRCANPAHPAGCGARLAEELDRTIVEEGPETVACFIAEPISGATLGGAVPPDDYWPAVQEVCRRHGVLLIADEVMTGFGRTGRWFGCDHWGVRPDIVTLGKGTSSGYWPFAIAAVAGHVYEAIASTGGFAHGFTFSHSVVGAAVARAVLARLKAGDMVEASRRKGELLRSQLAAALADHPNVGDVRGLGLLVGVELVADRASRAPFPRSERVTERVVAAAREAGLLLYSSTGCADGADGDLLVLGPPFVTADEDLAWAAAATREALGAAGLGR